MILIAGLILAIARPRLFQQNLGLSTERPVQAVFVFDTSPSMDYKSADQRTRLDDAKKRADELLSELPAGSRIEIRTTADKPGEPIRPTRTLAEVRTRIQSLEIAVASPPLNAAVVAGLKELADVALKREDEAARKMPRLLCIFSDTTRGSWDPVRTSAVEAASDLVPPTRESLLAARAELANLLLPRKETPDKFAGIVDFEKNLVFLDERIPCASARPTSRFRGTPRIWSGRGARKSIREALRLLAAEPNAEDKEVDRWETALRKTLHALSGQETLWFDVGMNPLNDIAIARVDWPERGGESVETFSPRDTVPLGVVLQASGRNFQATLTCEHESGKLTRQIELKAGGRDEDGVVSNLPLTELKLGPGDHSVTLSLDVRDSWVGNNRRFATFQVREPKRILVVKAIGRRRSANSRAPCVPSASPSRRPSRPRSRRRCRRTSTLPSPFSTGLAEPTPGARAVEDARDVRPRRGRARRHPGRSGRIEEGSVRSRRYCPATSSSWSKSARRPTTALPGATIRKRSSAIRS